MVQTAIHATVVASDLTRDEGLALSQCVLLVVLMISALQLLF